MLTAGFLEDGLWEISDDFGERNPVERWEKSNSIIMFGVFLALNLVVKQGARKILRFYTLFFKEENLFLLAATLMRRREKRNFLLLI